jgi:hypothetical protein
LTQITMTAGQVRQILAPFTTVMQDFVTEMQEKLSEIDQTRNQERAGSRPDNSRILKALKAIFHEYTTLSLRNRHYTRRSAPFDNLMTDWRNMSQPTFARLELEKEGFFEWEPEPGFTKRSLGNSLSNEENSPDVMGFSVRLSLPVRQSHEGRWRGDEAFFRVIYDCKEQKTLIESGLSRHSTHRLFELKSGDDLKEILNSWFLRHGREYSALTGLETKAKIVWSLNPHPEDYPYRFHGQEEGGPKASWG